MKIHTNNSEHYQDPYNEFYELIETNRIKEIKNKKRELYIYLIWALAFIIVFLKESMTFGSLSVWISIIMIILVVIAFNFCIKVITTNISLIKVLKSIHYHLDTIELPVHIKYWTKEEIDNLTTYTYIFEFETNNIDITPKSHFLMNDDQVVSYKTHRQLEVGEQAKYLAKVTLPICHKDTIDHFKAVYINHVLAIRIPEIDLVVDCSS